MMWSTPPTSPCAKNAAAPERVVYVGVNYDYVTADDFVPRYAAVIANIKARYPSVKRIDLMTLVRAPGNMPCPGNLAIKTWIRPGQAEAIQIMARDNPGFVYPTPKFEVRSCADFGLPPH